MNQKTYIIIFRVCKFIPWYLTGIDKHYCWITLLILGFVCVGMIMEVDCFFVANEFSILCYQL